MTNRTRQWLADALRLMALAVLAAVLAGAIFSDAPRPLLGFAGSLVTLLLLIAGASLVNAIPEDWKP